VKYNSRSNWGHLEELTEDQMKSVEVIQGDVRDRDSVRRLVDGTSAVFHLAALVGIPYSYEAPQSYVDTNVNGTLNVLEACRHGGVDVMAHTSTSEVYGSALYTPIDEKHPLQAQSPYSATKIAADHLADSYFWSFGVPVATVRPFNTFGPRQSARAIIPTVISQALAGRPIRLGSLHPVRDLTFVEDTARGFIAAAEYVAAQGRATNFGNGAGITIGDLAKKILTRVGREPVVETDEQRVRPDKSEVQKLICENSVAANLLNWTPQVSLDDGIDRTIEYVRTHLDDYKVDRYAV
jgi:NAD dependent epimerase/dehydratase